MEQFSLEKWLQEKSRKLVTRDGRPARIVCWDRNTKYWKIVGLVTSPDGSTENPFTYDVNGNESDGCLHDHRNDLFFADEEEELTEFEKMLRYALECYSGYEVASKSEIETLKLNARSLLNLARKELEANYYTKVLDDRMVFKSELHATDLQTAYDMGKQDALKDLPKWKKSYHQHETFVWCNNTLFHGEYQLSLDDLDNLPKEE